MGQRVQAALGEVPSLHKKEIFYSKYENSLEQPPQGRDRVYIVGSFQDVIGQGTSNQGYSVIL